MSQATLPARPAPRRAVIITGCSTGLGLEMAMHLAGQGFGLRHRARPDHEEEVFKEAEARGVKVSVLRLDLTDHEIDPASPRPPTRPGRVRPRQQRRHRPARLHRGHHPRRDPAVVRGQHRRHGRGHQGRAAVHARGQKGRIVTITSVGGRVSTYGVGLYCASKFAQEGMAEALYLEMAPFGCRSIIIEPGIIKTTRWDENRGEATTPATPTARTTGIPSRAKPSPTSWSNARGPARRRRRGRAQGADRRQPQAPLRRREPAAAVIMARRLLPNRLFERLYFGGFLRSIGRAAPAPG